MEGGSTRTYNRLLDFRPGARYAISYSSSSFFGPRLPLPGSRPEFFQSAPVGSRGQSPDAVTTN
jgi:hypothetical protein